MSSGGRRRRTPARWRHDALATRPVGTRFRAVPQDTTTVRVLIGDSGGYSVGASWNSVGKHVTTIFQYPSVNRLIR